MKTEWDSELATFLEDLSAVQAESLELLNRKREMLARADTDGLAALTATEEDIVQRLQQCVGRREELLEQAAAEGLPATNLREVAGSLPGNEGKAVARSMHQASGQARLLAHHSLINWVLTQRTLIHLSQLIEIIATGGRMKPTYDKGEKSIASAGSLVDHTA